MLSDGIVQVGSASAASAALGVAPTRTAGARRIANVALTAAIAARRDRFRRDLRVLHLQNRSVSPGFCRVDPENRPETLGGLRV